MMKWKKLYKNYINLLVVSILLFFNTFAYSNETVIKIEGNNFTDKNVILSLLDNIPDEVNEDYQNYILKTLDNSKLFENVEVKIVNNLYYIYVKECTEFYTGYG